MRWLPRKVACTKCKADEVGLDQDEEESVSPHVFFAIAPFLQAHASSLLLVNHGCDL